VSIHAAPGNRLRVAVDGRVLGDRFPGIGRYVFNLVRSLPAVDPDLEVVLLVEEGARPGRLDPRELAGDRCTLLPVRAGIRSPAAQFLVGRALARSAADVFHATYWLTPFRPRPPKVLSLYDLTGLGPVGGLSLPKRLALEAILRAALAGARGIVTLSAWSASAIRAWGPARGRPITVTPLAADPAFHRADAAAVEEARRAYGLTGRYVAYLGSFKPHKNLATLVAAWPDVQARAMDATLVLAGVRPEDDPYLAALAHSVGSIAPVRLIGPIPESHVAGFLTGATAFAFPSLAEGFGLPPLEAMAVGTPVVAARAGGLTEVVATAGVLVDPLDTAAWSAALVSVLTDPRAARELSEAGLRRASEFTWDETARRTAGAYRAAAAAGPRRRDC
jgi:alpha-1,3-rhamnosyl/mannosyltransferase